MTRSMEKLIESLSHAHVHVIDVEREQPRGKRRNEFSELRDDIAALRRRLYTLAEKESA
jgi:polyhydroxyalkanoate synthesis regulator phasin